MTDPDYAWVGRHTWQSWRERYKKNATRLDALVAAIVEEKKPSQGEKGQYGYVRQPEEKPKRIRVRKHKSASETNVVGSEASTSTPGAYAEHPPTTHQFVHENHPPGQLQPESGPPLELFQNLHAPGDGPLDPGTRDGAAEEEMDAADEDPDFVVRVGHEPPPKWGKRKVSDSFATDGDATSKRHKPQ